MKSLRKHLSDYLLMRRALGFRLKRQGKALANFVSFMESNKAAYITTSNALEWAQLSMESKHATWASRLSNVRKLAQYVAAFDSRTEVPPVNLLPHKPQRVQPYLYTDDEIEQLMAAALKLPVCPFQPGGSMLKRQTYYCLIGLLSVTGMRISEATNLEVKDVDLAEGVITIRGAKHGKVRLIPLHASTVVALTRFKEHRTQYQSGDASDYFFINRVGKALDHGTVRRTFYDLLHQVGLLGLRRKKKKRAATGQNKRPRIHDLRHRFAVRSLIRWYQRGEDAERKLPVLSTYLGHVHVSDTYWYLTAYPELMKHGVELLERRWQVKP
jgi:integrase